MPKQSNGSSVPRENLEEEDKEFWKIYSGVSGGDGMMEDDLYFLTKFYGVKHPHE